MATDIQIKRSGATGTTPPTLEPGELAISMPGGVLWYGNTSSQAVMLAQKVDVSESREAIVDPRVGLFHYNPNTQNLYICTNTSPLTWGVVGFPVAGGNVSAPMTISGDPNGTIYFQTLENDETNFLGPHVQVEALVSLNFIVAEGDIVGDANMRITNRITCNALVVENGATVEDQITRGSMGSFMYHHNGDHNSGEVRFVPIAQTPPDATTGANGDVWFGW